MSTGKNANSLKIVDLPGAHDFSKRISKITRSARAGHDNKPNKQLFPVFPDPVFAYFLIEAHQEFREDEYAGYFEPQLGCFPLFEPIKTVFLVTVK